MTTAVYSLASGESTSRLLRAIGGSPGAGRLVRALLERGLDEAALTAAAALAVQLDELAQGSAGEDFIGTRFGRLTVIAAAGRIKNRSYWLCVCDCGVEKRIRGDSLKGRNTTSCGCLQRELFAQHRRGGRSEAMAGVGGNA